MRKSISQCGEATWDDSAGVYSYTLESIKVRIQLRILQKRKYNVAKCQGVIPRNMPFIYWRRRPDAGMQHAPNVGQLVRGSPRKQVFDEVE